MSFRCCDLELNKPAFDVFKARGLACPIHHNTRVHKAFFCQLSCQRDGATLELLLRLIATPVALATAQNLRDRPIASKWCDLKIGVEFNLWWLLLG